MPYNNYRRKVYRRRYNRRYYKSRKPYKKPVRYKIADMAYSGYKMGLKGFILLCQL